MIVRPLADARPPLPSSLLVMDQVEASLRSGNLADAEQLLRRRLLTAPGDFDALVKLADLLVGQDRRPEAIHCLKRAMVAAPAVHGLRLHLVRLLHGERDLDHALDELSAIGEPVRSGLEALAIEAAILGELGRHEEQLAIYARLVRDHPSDETLWMSRGNALKTVGRTDEAIKAFRRAARARPSFGEAYWSFANLKTFKFEARDLVAMRKALAGQLSESDALHFHFALGKALEDRGDAENSFRHYAAGNQIRRARLTPAQVSATAHVDATIATFDKALFDRFCDAGDPARDPIFVVGLQRSGSTLVEQILASHPLIEGTAELVAIPQMWERLGQRDGSNGDSFAALARLDDAGLKELGAEYLRRTRAHRVTDRPMFVDKLPANWMYAGFIRLILPNARIIDARRHPIACGFSNFKQHYATGVSYAYGLDSIGRFYADYVRQMAHFDEVQPCTMHRIINERLIEDPEREIRRLLDFAGVPFDPACMDFHRNKRAVQTPSSEQVRRPINREGVDSWRPYEPWLGPLKDALGDALEYWDR
ncbi:MAG TPA: sulfotransferase [Sphingomicrobium sp.]|nr:sulfotransferase [Sphingomicrobium sp.]